MTFTAFETSNQNGRPVSLYEFQYGNTYWRYTSADQEITVGLNEVGTPATWLPIAISDGGFTQGGSEQNDLTVSCPLGLPVTTVFQVSQPSGKVWLKVREYHIGDLDEETPLRWIGNVIGASPTDAATVQLNCRSIVGTYDRNGLRLTWSRSCTLDLYGISCRVLKADHDYARQIATLTGNSLTCVTHAEPVEGSFSGGFLEFTRLDGSIERKGIETQTGNSFLILGSTVGLQVGSMIILYPGCARDTATCKLFNNLPNYGGFPHLPGKSPFDGSPVF